jgi:hypothetical protein
MTVSGKWFGSAFLAAFNKEIDWNETNKIKVGLCTSTYSPDQDVHNYYDDITNELTTTGGYTLGGMVLPTPTLTYTGATNIFKLDGDDCAWTSATFTARYAFIYYDTGTASTSPLLGYVDFGADMSVSAATFTLQWDTAGILITTVS